MLAVAGWHLYPHLKESHRRRKLSWSTRRFDSILETMRTSGFHNFDEMAVAYYTGRFSTGSVPSIMQCSSRSRRLKVILQKLHQDSQEWPKWESWGLHESMSIATGKN